MCVGGLRAACACRWAVEREQVAWVWCSVCVLRSVSRATYVCGKLCARVRMYASRDVWPAQWAWEEQGGEQARAGEALYLSSPRSNAVVHVDGRLKGAMEAGEGRLA